MTDNKPAVPPAFTREVVYQLPYAGEIKIGLSYGDGTRRFDIYYPENRNAPAPVVVFIMGFPDPGFQAMTGSCLKDCKPYQSWARLIAASGMAAVLYTSEEPATDSLSLFADLVDKADSLGLDRERIGIWACSGNVPNALHMLNQVAQIGCAMLGYGFMLDLGGSTAVADSAVQFRFVNPNQGIEDFPAHTPLQIVKAGKEEFPGLNDSIDAFMEEARKRGSEVELIEFESGVHAFDVLDDSEDSKQVVVRMVGFLKSHLLD